MKKLRWLLLACSLAICNVIAETPEEMGLSVAREYDRRDLGYIDFIANMEMTLINAEGETSVRKIKTKTLEVENVEESERRLLVFDYPNDVKGTVLLTVSKKTETDDQWIYFPAIKRVKRISSSNRSGPFMGSEFSYEDFSAPIVEKYTYKYISTTACEALICHHFERYPIEKNSGYTKQVLWVDTEEYRLWKIEFYDRKKSLLKILSVSDYKKYTGKYWRAGRMRMENVQTKKQTVLAWDDYAFLAGLKSGDFVPAVMQKAR